MCHEKLYQTDATSQTEDVQVANNNEDVNDGLVENARDDGDPQIQNGNEGDAIRFDNLNDSEEEYTDLTDSDVDDQ